MVAATIGDLVLVTIFAARGILMTPVPLVDIGVLLATVLAVTLLLDLVKAPLLSRIRSEATPLPEATR